jgi:CheY-like chemotaxis protein
VTAKPFQILLVEDDQIYVMSVERALAKRGTPLSVLTATNGVEALEILRRGEGLDPRLLVLLDLNMPRMNGLEFLAELRADPKLHDTHVVVLTTSAEPADRTAAYRYNVAGYLVKPASFARFTELMDAIVGYWSLVEM